MNPQPPTEAPNIPDLFFQSLGLIKGKYMPSEDNLDQGVLLTNFGLFPVTIPVHLYDNLTKFFTRKPKEIKKKHHFFGWLAGISEPPYYHFYLFQRRGKKDFPYGFPESNSFKTQGFISQRTPDKVILKVQKNPKLDRTTEDLENSVNYLEIKDCPSNVRKSQFWLFHSSFEDDGFLHCKHGEFLANAQTTKKVLATKL